MMACKICALNCNDYYMFNHVHYLEIFGNIAYIFDMLCRLFVARLVFPLRPSTGPMLDLVWAVGNMFQADTKRC